MKTKNIQCLECENNFDIPLYREKKAKFCSQKCQGKFISKKFWENRFNWKSASPEESYNRLKKTFEKKVIRKEGCWDWGGVIMSTGYGVLEYKGKQLGAHRASWIIHKGEITKGMFICHSCDNAVCSNPEHLFLGEPKDNTQDMLKKNRRSNCRQYSKNAKLNIHQVKEIKDLLKDEISQTKIAKIYNVSRGTIQDIYREKSWKNI